MTTSRIYAYRWPARLVSHKPFAAESYSITPSCIWQVFFRKKNEFSFLFSPFCQRAHFLCKMHNPQAFLPVENSAAPAVQCLVWAILPLLYIYNKKQGRSTTVLALSGANAPALPKGEPLAKPVTWHLSRKLYRHAKASPFGRGGSERSELTERARLLPCRAAVSEGNKRRQAAASLYDPTRENGIPERPQTLRYAENINNSSADDATATTAACGRSREELLGPWPAGCKARSRAVAAAGCHNSSKAKRRPF